MRAKLKHFKDNAQSSYVFEPGKEDYYNPSHAWSEVFGNQKPLVLELGCGRGAYTIGLAQKYPNINVIGIDVKGDRIWHGVKEAERLGLHNARFLRTHIERIEDFFAPGEVSEIWITFPDPHPKRRSENRRLTGSRFLERYAQLLKPQGILHIKTDSQALYEFSQEAVRNTELFTIQEAYSDIAAQSDSELLHEIQTLFEVKYRAQGRPITYLKLSKANS